MAKRPITLEEELRQTRPFASSSEEAVVALLRTAALRRRAIARRVEPYGISVSQYNVLRILRGAGDEGLPTLAVRDRLVEEAPGITRLIDKLESAALVARDRTGKDRRTVRCRITPEGLALLARLDTEVGGEQAPVRSGLPEDADRRRLLELLQRVREGLRADG
jgi:MarR family transcriptional regulator, organic hydroperoxide resistance regulator